MALPDGPIARPAAGAVTSAHIRVAVKPLGSIPYDGIVLPLVAPSGRFLAVQEGTAPTWPTLLATDDATVPLGAALFVYDLEAFPPQRVAFAHPLPPGLMLGRAADDEGFLVEAPRPEGGRWIGKVAWASGRVQWLVQGAATAAHGVLTTAGELVYTRRTPGEATQLVLRTREGREIVRTAGGGEYLFPIAPLDPAAIYALVATPDGLEVEAISLIREPELTGPARWGATLPRTNVSTNNEPAMAYQIAAPTQNTATLWRRGGSSEAAVPEPLVIFHPRLERMGAMDKATGRFFPLAPQSIAATNRGVAGERGFFCTAPEGVVFTPFPGFSEVTIDGGQRRTPDARVLGGSYVSRLSSNPERPLVLLGPSRADPGRLELAVMTIVRQEPETP